MTTARKKLSPLDAALALQNKGDLEGAEAGYRSVIGSDPENPDALVLLGILLQKTKRAGEAVELIEKAIASAPRKGRQPDPAWWVALTFARRDSGDAEGALAELDALIAKAKPSPDLQFMRAGLLQRLDRHEEAIPIYEGILERAPGNAQAWNNLGISLKEAGRLKESFDAFNKAVELNPKYIAAMVNAGQFLSDLGQTEAAIRNMQRAHTIDPDNRKVAHALIEALQAGDRGEQAARLAEKCFESDPEDPVNMIHLGQISMTMGKRERAVALARKAFEQAPHLPGSLLLLAEADREADKEDLLNRIEEMLVEFQGYTRSIGLHFAAARLCEKLKRYEGAFDHFVAGNSVRREQLERLEKPYDPAMVERNTARMIEAFDAARCAEPGGSPSEIPVFIVGMPRSGTTLTEQIIASHPDAVGAGELSEIAQIATWLRRQHDFPATLSDEQAREGAKGYLSYVGKIGKGAARVTDKMPGNWQHLGLITRMFPKARIIHTRRDAMDNCLSCFAQNFKADGLGWSTDLETLGHQYCQYSLQMAHWREVLPPGRMLEIDYEDTVDDLEAQARRIIEFVGLPWDDACLRFHETERAVLTASREQVRNPIYKTSVGRWKRYGAGVKPLVEALGKCGAGPGKLELDG